ncbi:MAG: glutamate--tRNA ligase, partial [Alphaproteobacteria bacterium]|nr:glutamate--tRNA ligase [Alphaproteobacteria bacterium]
GEVTVDNVQLDDFVLLRADGTPTYMLAVVVDDHDMGVTHVIRGDDHLNNAFRQYHLWRACGWDVPVFAHIPLIHGADGAKLSKRHGAVGLEAYRDDGYLPEAIRNYLLRLGWSHGDDEVIATTQAIEWFGLEAVGRSPARFDRDRLDNLNGHWLRVADDARLVDLILPRVEAELGRPVDATGRARLRAGMNGLKQRVKTLVELAAAALFYCRTAPVPFEERAAKLLTPDARARLGRLSAALAALPEWNESTLDEAVRGLAGADDVKLGDIAQPLRAALTGSTVSPGIFEVMAILGRDESLARLGAVHTR